MAYQRYRDFEVYKGTAIGTCRFVEVYEPTEKRGLLIEQCIAMDDSIVLGNWVYTEIKVPPFGKIRYTATSVLMEMIDPVFSFQPHKWKNLQTKLS